MDRTAKTISEFRRKVNDNKGLQQVSKYMVTFVDPLGEAMDCYPESVTLPQRSFVQVPFSYWGPAEQIPIRREYGECAMTFIIYQDWLERKYFERWMDLVIPPYASEESSGEGISFLQTIFPVSNPFSTEISANQYSDYSNTIEKQLGNIVVYALNADHSPSQGGWSSNAVVHMTEAYPVSITPTSLSSEATGFGTFVVVFAFKRYGFF